MNEQFLKAFFTSTHGRVTGAFCALWLRCLWGCVPCKPQDLLVWRILGAPLLMGTHWQSILHAVHLTPTQLSSV